jgi:hypothetical protein
MTNTQTIKTSSEAENSEDTGANSRLPHQESDLKPDDLVEVEQEPLDEKKAQRSEKPTQPDERENQSTPVVEVDDSPLPEVYLKAETSPDEISEKIEALGEYEPPKPKAVPAQVSRVKSLPATNNKSFSETEPQPKIPKITRWDSEKAEDFVIRFKKKLTDLLALANQTRQDQVEKNLKTIMQYAYEHQKVTNDDVERITGVKHVQAADYLKTLTRQGKLVKFGKTKNTFYKPIKK